MNNGENHAREAVETGFDCSFTSRFYPKIKRKPLEAFKLLNDTRFALKISLAVVWKIHGNNR